MFSGSEIAFPKFPCELLYRLLPCDRSDDKTAVFVDIDRFENIGATWHEIGGEKEIFMKSKSLRVYEIDLVFRATVDHEHRMRQGIRRVLVIDAGDGIEFFSGVYFYERVLF